MTNFWKFLACLGLLSCLGGGTIYAQLEFPACATAHMISLERKIFKLLYSQPDLTIPYIDSLKADLEHQPCLVMEARVHHFQAQVAGWHNRIEEALQEAQVGLDIALASQDADQISTSYNQRGVFFDQAGQLDSALAAYQLSKKWGDLTTRIKNPARALLNIGMIYRTKGDYAKSLESLNEAKEICIKNDHRPYLPNLFLTLGELYLLLGDFEKAADNLDSSLHYATMLSKSRTAAAAMSAFGQLSEALRDTNEALCWYHASLLTAQDAKLEGKIAEYNAKLARIYASQGDLQRAQKAARVAIEISSATKDSVTLSEARYAMGLVQLASGQAAAAFQNCQSAYALAQRKGQTIALAPICDCAWRSATAAGLHQQALKFYQQFVQLNDSLNNAENALAIGRLEAKLDYEQRHVADSLVQAAEALKQQTQYNEKLTEERSRSQMVLLLGGIAAIGAVLGAIVALVFRRNNRRLARSNALVFAQNSTIQAALMEKEVLLRELHHRVKNNLQVMISLIDMQMQRVEDPAAKAVLQASEGRVQAMTLIHKKLYQQDNLADLSFGPYMQQLVEAISQLYPQESEVVLEFDVLDCAFGIDTAVPLGLILNELVTNAFKYAFRPGIQGHLHLQLAAMDDGTFKLVVEDNGLGWGNGGPDPNGNTLGMQLVQGLSRQLKGRATFLSSPTGGARVEIEFENILI